MVVSKSKSAISVIKTIIIHVCRLKLSGQILANGFYESVNILFDWYICIISKFLC